MKMSLAVGDLQTLIWARQSHVEAGRNWADYNDCEVNQAFNELELIQEKILQCNFGDDSSKILALALLVEGDSQPNFPDDFKNKLYDLLRQVCESESSHTASE